METEASELPKSSRTLMVVAVQASADAGALDCELERVGPAEWRASLRRHEEGDLVVLATFYVASEQDAYASLIAFLYGTLIAGIRTGYGANGGLVQ